MYEVLKHKKRHINAVGDKSWPVYKIKIINVISNRTYRESLDLNSCDASNKLTNQRQGENIVVLQLAWEQGQYNGNNAFLRCYVRSTKKLNKSHRFL